MSIVFPMDDERIRKDDLSPASDVWQARYNIAWVSSFLIRHGVPAHFLLYFP